MYEQQNKQTCGQAIASMILGITSIVLCMTALTGIPAIICGHMARAKIRRSQGALGGDGMALAGLITGYIGTVLTIVAVIGLLAGLAVPGFNKAKNQSQARRIINDARQMDAAIDQWALEKGKKDGDPIDVNAASVYLKGVWPATDILGNPYIIGVVGRDQIKINPATKMSFDGCGVDWGNY